MVDVALVKEAEAEVAALAEEYERLRDEEIKVHNARVYLGNDLERKKAEVEWAKRQGNLTELDRERVAQANASNYTFYDQDRKDEPAKITIRNVSNTKWLPTTAPGAVDLYASADTVLKMGLDTLVSIGGDNVKLEPYADGTERYAMLVSMRRDQDVLLSESKQLSTTAGGFWGISMVYVGEKPEFTIRAGTRVARWFIVPHTRAHPIITNTALHT